jgi:phage tail sheath gpL-like
MSVDASAVARVLGISTTFRDLRGGSALYLPQSIAVFAQGASASTYATTKWQATSAAAAGARYGYGSPIHLILRELMPQNGDGVDSIPVNVYPMVDGPSSAAAVGNIVPSGTATAAGAYRLRVNGILSQAFVLPAGAITLNTALAAMGTAMAGVLEMPVNVGYTYGSVTASALTGTGNGTLTALSTTGTPLPGAWTLKVVTAVANGGVWSLTDPNGTIVSSALTMTPGVGAATVFNVGGLQFTLTDGTTDFGLGASFTITVPATNITFTSKWKGISANDLYIEVLGDSLGVVFTITQPTGGLVNPDINTALTNVGTAWETLGINALNYTDTTALDAIQTWGDGRWGELVHKPIIVFEGSNVKDVATLAAATNLRKTDRINSLLVAPGSVNLPFVVAARQLARIAKVANNNPPTDYCLQKATGLTPGKDSDQWDFVVRDQAVKAGCSTVEVIDGVVNMSNTVTMYHPTGESPPAYGFVCDIVKLQNIIFNLNMIFASSDWAGKPLIPDNQPTANPNSRKPRMALAAVQALCTSLADSAIISDPASARDSVICAIDSQNPRRLNVSLTVKLSGNTNIISVDLFFGFYFPVAAAA